MLKRDLATDEGYFAAPASLDPLPTELRDLLIAPGLAGILSALSTFALIIFILHRVVSWRQHFQSFIGYNQYVMLVLNLLVADLQQATAFLISWYWISQSKIVAPTAACFAQGWLLHSGDVSSGMFVLGIAVHTFLTAVLSKKISNAVFYSSIALLWLFSYAVTAIGVGMHPHDYFVRAGAWCWVNSAYQDERLWLHYFWIFLVEASIIVIYAVTFFALRRKTKFLIKNYREQRDAVNPKTVQAVNRITRLMTLYPCVYILLTLPLSAGRMWSMAHNGALTSDSFSIAAGTLLASCGWVDALLYTLTRKRLLNETMPGRRRSDTADTIHATKQVIIQHHGDLPRDNRQITEQPHFGGMPGDKRHGGLLIETPSSGTASIDPMADAEPVNQVQSRDWETQRRPTSFPVTIPRKMMPWD